MTSPALPGDYPLTLVRGDSRAWQITCTKDDGTPFDLTGYTFAAQIRTQDVDTDPPQATLTVTTDDPTTGVLSLLLPHAQSVNLIPGDPARWDLQLTRTADGFVRTYLSGKVKVIRDVTLP